MTGAKIKRIRLFSLIGIAAIATGCGPNLAQCRDLSAVFLGASDAAAQAQFAGFAQTSGSATEAQIAVEQTVANIWSQAADTVAALKVSGRDLKAVQEHAVEAYENAAALSLKAVEELSADGQLSSETEEQLFLIQQIGSPLDPNITQTMREFCSRI